MAVVKQRPALRLFVPREVVPGQIVRARLELECGRPTPVTRVVISLRGTSSFWQGEYQSQDTFLARRAELKVGRELEVGTHQLEALFPMPDVLPPSYAGRALRVQYLMNIRADIPWWPDARANYELQVVSAAPSEREAGRVWASRPEGSLPGRPYCELSIDSPSVQPGHKVRGAVALSNVDTNNYKALRFSLVAMESVRSHSEIQLPSELCHWRIAIPKLRENHPIPFSLGLPDGLTPNFTVGTAKLQWYLRLRVEVAWASDPELWIPLQISSPDEVEARAGEQALAPLAVGSKRLERLWQGVAEACGYEARGETLWCRLGQDAHAREVEIRREHRGRRGVFLRATLRYPSLELGVNAPQAAAESRPHAVNEVFSSVPRDPAQLHDFIPRLKERLQSPLPLRLRRISDTELVAELQDGGQSKEPLTSFVTQVRQLAEAWPDLVARIRAPRLSESLAKLWQRWALEGDPLAGSRSSLHYQAGGPSLRGVHSGQRWKVALEYSATLPDEPTRLRVRLDARHTLPSRWHFHWAKGQDPPHLDGLDWPTAHPALEVVVAREDCLELYGTLQTPGRTVDADGATAMELLAWGKHFAEQFEGPGTGFRR